MLEAIKYENKKLYVLNQLLLPSITVYEDVNSVQDAWNMIYSMKVRGAPAIAIVGALSIAVHLHKTNYNDEHSKLNIHQDVVNSLSQLVTARPTAVNMKKTADKLQSKSLMLLNNHDVDATCMKNKLIAYIENMLTKDLETNKAIGKNGGEHIFQNSKSQTLNILTHCNTGSLATSGYGTALGVIRWLHEQKMLNRVFYTETRPYNQGVRLTGFELIHEGIPATLVCDSMVAALMKNLEISAVVVGADRVVANGDTANKIGTYQIAISAKHHHVPFYVASPCSTIDLSLENGDKIPIEERPHREMLFVQEVEIAPKGTKCWNPAFDVTPAELITGGIITEKGVFSAEELKTKLLSHEKK